MYLINTLTTPRFLLCETVCNIKIKNANTKGNVFINIEHKPVQRLKMKCIIKIR